MAFTLHSQFCYGSFTTRLSILVTMKGIPGFNSNTMPTATGRRTVHFYQCDQAREFHS